MIAKEGYPFIIIFALIFLLVLILPKTVTAILAFFFLLLMVIFFRDPKRIAPDDPFGAVSPADGRVVEITPAVFQGEEFLKIGIFMNLFSVHINRFPFGGNVTEVRHIPGGFAPADGAKASLSNERNEIHISTAYGKIIAVQVAGLIARRTVSYVEAGDKRGRGERLGMIKFSSRVDLYLPKDARVNVSLGTKVYAGETIVAHLR
ncbi:MAG: phosphatidylserine decarboxylase family protein [Deferribacteraceae bacterium]|jgi:phosphatidylserine decarboxylase|nr:phosphatidylserine decarboxylase family protein [Deferribacteraceae bacterium]